MLFKSILFCLARPLVSLSFAFVAVTCLTFLLGVFSRCSHTRSLLCWLGHFLPLGHTTNDDEEEEKSVACEEQPI